jgi:hypothetical protein
MLQIKLIKKEEGHPDRQDKIIPMKERLIENLQIHLADADPQLKRDQQLRNTLPTPEEFAEVSGDRLVMKRFVLQLVFGALGTYMGTLTDKKYERLQESLTTTNIMQKKLIEVVNNQDSLIQWIAKSLDYNNLFDYLVIQNPANLETAHQSSGNRVKAEINRIQNVLQITQWRRLALSFLSTNLLQNLYTTLKQSAQTINSELLITKSSDLL